MKVCLLLEFCESSRTCRSLYWCGVTCFAAAEGKKIMGSERVHNLPRGLYCRSEPERKSVKQPGILAVTDDVHLETSQIFSENTVLYSELYETQYLFKLKSKPETCVRPLQFNTITYSLDSYWEVMSSSHAEKKTLLFNINSTHKLFMSFHTHLYQPVAFLVYCQSYSN